MEIFLEQLSDEFPNDYHILLCDCASWHTSQEMSIPENVLIFNIPPCTPEMNPMEQIWRELRSQGFRNVMFHSLDKAISHLCQTIRKLDPPTVKSITARSWLLQCFL
jgi:transposase